MNENYMSLFKRARTNKLTLTHIYVYMYVACVFLCIDTFMRI